MMSEPEQSRKHWLHHILALVALVVFGMALWALHRELKHFQFSEFRNYLDGLSAFQITVAIGATVISYMILVGYDLFAFRYVRQKLELSRIALTAFIGFAFSMNIGQAALSGGAVRMRLYTGWGVGTGDVGRVIGFNFIIGMVGQAVVAGLLFLFVGVAIPASLPMPFQSVRWLGAVLILAVIGFFLLICMRKAPLQFKSWRLEIPGLRIAIPAVIVSACDWLLSGVVLFAFLPAASEFGVGHFLAIVMCAHIVAVISMVPGGLGVFETVVIHLLPESIPRQEVLSGLIAFRAIYYLFPFVLAILLMGSHEAITRKQRISAVTVKINRWLSPFIPRLLGIMSFVAGSILLLSGSMPAVGSRLTAVSNWIPLVAVELSHFLGSLVGIGLVILSGALRRRIDAAYFFTIVLLVAGIVFSLVKGLDYEEAAILALMLLALIPCRRHFYRRASLFSMRFTPAWWLGVGLVLATITWIGFAAFERVHYHPDLWLHFGIKGDAARFLRASAGIAVVFAGFGLWQLLRPGSRDVPPLGGEADLARVLALVVSSTDTSAWLATLGDKRFLFSESGHSVIMFGIHGRTWIAMGDPLGDPDEHEDLIWEFREHCDAAGARAVFYQVNAERAHAYAGVGMFLYKLGEDARVPLVNFSLENSSRKQLRRTQSRQQRDGVSFEIIPAKRFDEFTDELRSISDAWLLEKSAGEKSFSLGNFNENYLRHFDFAIVRLDGKIVAFANILASARKEELSVDLMRHTSGAPHSVMEYLFIELILWGKAEGYSWFNLGMAPLSGLENRPLAPVWNRIGEQIFSHGEHFYNFKGLRSYKEKFDPEWRPKYLACRNTLSLPLILLDVSALIGGGLVQSLIGKSKKETPAK